MVYIERITKVADELRLLISCHFKISLEYLGGLNGITKDWKRESEEVRGRVVYGMHTASTIAGSEDGERS